MRVWKKGKRGHPTYQPCYKAAGILDSGTGTAPSTYGCPISIAGAFRRSHVSSPAGSNGYVTGRPPVRNPVVVVVFPQARSLLSLFYPVSVRWTLLPRTMGAILGIQNGHSVGTNGCHFAGATPWPRAIQSRGGLRSRTNADTGRHTPLAEVLYDRPVPCTRRENRETKSVSV